MQMNRKTVAIGAAIGALAVAGAGIAYGVSGGGEEQVTGPDAEKAKAAAIETVGGGTVTEAEYQEAGSSGVYEVEVQRPDGSQVEVYIDGSFDPVGSAADDDAGEGAEDEAGEGADDD